MNMPVNNNQGGGNTQGGMRGFMQSLPAVGSLFRPVQNVSAVPSNVAPSQPQPGGTMQTNNGGESNPATPTSPLDSFKDIWKNDPNQPDPNANPFESPLFATDPTKLMEAVSAQDFTKQLPQELRAKIAQGDGEAMLQATNMMTQQAMGLILQLTTATTEQAGKKIGERFNSVLPNKMRDFAINQTPPSNPALQHPAAQPMLKMLREQAQRTNPQASPAEINKMAEDYFASLSQAFVAGDPTTQQQQTQQRAEDSASDFSNWA